MTLRTGVPTVDTAIADRVGFLRWSHGDWTGQIDLAAGLFLGFDPGGQMTFGMQTVDGLIRLPLSARHGPLSASLEWAHVSAHYADGIRNATDQPLPERATYSREYIRLQTSWEMDWFTPYLACRQLIHSLPEAPGFGVQGGWMIYIPGVPVYQAVDLKLSADEEWQPGAQAQLGLVLSSESIRTLHVGFIAMTGPDDTGQRSGEDDRFIGVQFGFHRIPANPQR